jgi:hypothetical protein
VGRKRVATLMRRMGIAALYRHPRTTQPHPGIPGTPYSFRIPGTPYSFRRETDRGEFQGS